MSTPFDSLGRMKQTIEMSLRVADYFNQQTPIISNVVRSIASSPVSNFHSAISIMNSPAIVASTKAFSSPDSVSVLDSLNHSNILSITNRFAYTAAISFPQDVLDSIYLAQKLAKQLTFPPVYSFSSAAAKISANIIDPGSGAFTPVFSNLAIEISKMPISSFEYSFDNAGNINLSEQLEHKLSSIVNLESNKSNSHRKIISKEFFCNVMLPIILALLQLGYNMYSDAQLAKLLEQQHQEKISIQRQLLNEEHQQTEYLRQISDSLEKSIPAKEYGQSS